MKCLANPKPDCSSLYLSIDVVDRPIRFAHSTRYDISSVSWMLSDSQTGIVGGFVPPTISAIHDITLDTPDTPHILLLSTFPSDPAAQQLGPKQKNIAKSEDTTSLVKELEGILRTLPTEKEPSSDIYERDIGIFWQGPDGFEWVNSAPQGCGSSGPGRGLVTEDHKKAFNRAVEITEVLVKRGVAQEGT